MKLGIQKRIIFIILVVLILSGIITGFSIVFLSDVSGMAEKIYNHPFTVSRAVLILDKNIVLIEKTLAEFFLSESAVVIHSKELEIKGYYAIVETQLAIIEDKVLDKEEGDRYDGPFLATQIGTDYRAIKAKCNAIIDYIKTNELEEARKLYNTDKVLFFNSITINVEHLLEFALGKADSFKEGVKKTTSFYSWTILIGLVFYIALALFFALYFARNLSIPIVDATQNLNTAIAQIMASVQQQAANTKEQAASIQQTTTTMDEISQAGKQVSEKASRISQTSGSNANAVQIGINAVADVNRMMSAIREQVELVAENIVNLSEKTLTISEIINTVNDIAEQSNLLALNASIEAVSAGNHGVRFSVVANEIKNLADQAKESTVQVRSILEEIQKGINSSVMLTEEAVKRVETGKEKADVSLDTINQLAASIQENLVAFQQIVGATNQQQIGLEQVTAALNNINETTEQTAMGITQIEDAVVSLNDLSRKLQRLVHEA